MNIFVLDLDTAKAAEYHCDKHVPKMTLETAQLLSTMVHSLDGSNVKSGFDAAGEPICLWHGIKIYKPTHHNHPCSVWVRGSVRNARWLCNLGHQLSYQSELRWHKPAYKAHQIIKDIHHRLEFLDFKNIGANLDQGFAMAMPAEITALGLDPVTSYRLYYASAKAGFADWKRTGKVPYWWRDAIEHAKALGLSTLNLANDGVKG